MTFLTFTITLRLDDTRCFYRRLDVICTSITTLIVTSTVCIGPKSLIIISCVCVGYTYYISFPYHTCILQCDEIFCNFDKPRPFYIMIFLQNFDHFMYSYIHQIVG